MDKKAADSRSGGVYIPPFRLAMMAQETSDKSSAEYAKIPSLGAKSVIRYQRIAWDALRKSINGYINKVNASNIGNILPELFKENLIRARGVLCKSLMKAQSASMSFTPIYAALIAVINTKLPEIGELLLKRLIIQFKRAYTRNDKRQCIATTTFIAHLVNQLVASYVLALQIVTVLLETPTDDSVEIAVGFVKEVGAGLADNAPAQAIHAIFERFRAILHEGQIDKRVQYTIEGLFSVRKAGFKENPAIPTDLDIVDSDDQITHELTLEDALEKEDKLDYFTVDPDYLENEAKYEELKTEILGEDAEPEDDDKPEGDAEGDAETSTAGQVIEDKRMDIKDATDSETVTLKRNIYLTIMSSLDFEEGAHKLMKIQMTDEQKPILIHMLIECCSQEKTFARYYGLLSQRFCLLDRVFKDAFEEAFREQYDTIHRLETNKLRNVAKLFAHLFYTDAIDWPILEHVHLNEEETTSSSRIFIKILFQELAEYMGLQKLAARLADPTISSAFYGLFPIANPRDTRFSINFFTSIGLGGLTEGLRSHLKEQQKLAAEQRAAQQKAALEAAKREESESSSSESSSSSSSSESESDRDSRKRRRSRRSRSVTPRKKSDSRVSRSPPRKADRSPPRKADRSPPRKADRSPPRKADRSPPRKADRSPAREAEVDRSPPRRAYRSPSRERSPVRSDRSPPRRTERSPPRRSDRSSRSPPRRRSRSPPRRRSRTPPSRR